MFKTDIFRFNGQITREEYAVSVLIFSIILILTVFIFGITFPSLILFILSSWFLLSQGVKRCHDLKKSGLYQFIPFYPIILILKNGNIIINDHNNQTLVIKFVQKSYIQKFIFTISIIFTILMGIISILLILALLGSIMILYSKILVTNLII